MPVLPAPKEVPCLPLTSAADARPCRLGQARPDGVLDITAMLVLLVGLIGCALASGCSGREVGVELLELRSVGPDVVEAGRRIAIDGANLPEGAEAELVLDGTLHTPSGARAVRLSLSADVVSEDHAEALVTGAFLEDIGGESRGTFRGRAELRVPIMDGEGAVSGSLEDVVVDLRPSALLELETDDEGSTEVDPMLGLMAQVEPEPDPTAPRRTVITEVDDAGRASDLGAHAGDELLAIEGMRIVGAGDLSGWSRRVASLTVRRAGRELVLSSAPSTSSTPTDRVRILQAAALLAVLLVLLRERDRSSLRAHAKVGALRRGLPAMLALALVLAIVHGVVARLQVERLAEIAAPVALLLALVGATSAGAGVLLAGGRIGLLAVGLTSALVTAGATDLSELWDAQTMAPIGWALLRTPVAPALAILFASALPARPDASARPWARWAAAGACAVVIAAIVLCVCGGLGERTGWGTLLFVARGVIVATVLLATLRALEGLSLRTRAMVVLGALAIVLAHVAAVLTLGPLDGILDVVDGASPLALASAEVWLAAVALGAGVALLPPRAPRMELELAL